MARIIPRDFFYAAIIFTMLTTGIVGLLTLVQEGDSAGGGTSNIFEDSDVDEIVAFNRTFNIQENVTGKMDLLKTKLGEITVKGDATVITAAGALISSSWIMIVIIKDSFGLMNSAFEGMVSFLGVPIWVPVLIITLIIAMFMFSIISFIFKKDI